MYKCKTHKSSILGNACFRVSGEISRKVNSRISHSHIWYKF